MNILVILGTGFVGQHLVSLLAKENHKITVLCRKNRSDSYFYINIKKLKNVKVKSGVDVTDYALLKPHFNNVDIVINLAGLVSFKQRDKKKLMQINVKGSFNVLKACESYNVKQLIHLSSTAALGFSNGLISEEHNFNWSNHKKCVYSYSKYVPNKRIKGSSCNTVLIYPPLILGPGDNTNTSVLIDVVKKNKIPFNLSGVNSYVDVRDLTNAIKLIIDKKVKNNDFIVAAETNSVSRMNKKISSVLNVSPTKKRLSKKISIMLSNFILFLEKRLKDLPVTYETIFMGSQKRVHDSLKIRQLGWKPKYDLERTIKDSFNWMRGDFNE